VKAKESSADLPGSVFSMRRELYTVRNKTVKKRISTEISDGTVGEEEREKLQKVTETDFKSMKNANSATHEDVEAGVARCRNPAGRPPRDAIRMGITIF
jgi:hypothetical protein